MKIILLTYFSLLFIISSANAQNETEGQYPWKYNTIMHRLVQMEEQAVKNANKKRTYKLEKQPDFLRKYQLIDEVIGAAITGLSSTHQSAEADATTKALKALETIDQVLTSFHLMVCTNISPAAETLTSDSYDAIAYTTYREALFYNKFLNDKTALFYPISNDLNVLFYMAIGEVADLPITLVELPGNHLIRWRINEADHIDWDSNLATPVNVDELKNDPLYPVLSASSAAQGAFLRTFDNGALEGYFNTLVAGFFQREQLYIGAIEYYEKAMALRPYSTLTQHNFAWMFLSTPALTSRNLYIRAYEMTTEVNRILPDYSPYKSTYACACAAIGNFNKALKYEKEGANAPEKLDGFRRGLTCLDMIELAKEQ